MGEGMALSLVRTITTAKQRHSTSALPDPYHETEQVLLHQLGADSGLEGEQFDGRSYMLRPAIECVSRRLWRQFLAGLWSDVTRIEFLEFQPSTRAFNGDGSLRVRPTGAIRCS